MERQGRWLCEGGRGKEDMTWIAQWCVRLCTTVYIYLYITENKLSNCYVCVFIPFIDVQPRSRVS